MHCINTDSGSGSGDESSISASTSTGIQERSYSYFLSKRPVLFLRVFPNSNGCSFGDEIHLILIRMLDYAYFSTILKLNLIQHDNDRLCHRLLPMRGWHTLPDANNPSVNNSLLSWLWEECAWHLRRKSRRRAVASSHNVFSVCCYTRRCSP